MGYVRGCFFCVFLSTLSLRRATTHPVSILVRIVFLSTLSLRRATAPPYNLMIHHTFLSTLSLRRATASDRLSDTSDVISIHALLAESDVEKVPADVYYQAFLSTLSLRRATALRQLQSALRRNFYPRSPCGERHQLQGGRNSQNIISIHALLAESDHSSVRSHPGKPISIHALLAESDRKSQFSATRINKFLSTLSLRRATKVVKNKKHCMQRISIHALLAESDKMARASTCMRFTFLSTLSLRRATAKVHKTVGHFCAYETNFMGIASSC